MPELRKDPIIGRWVIIATERAKRPDDFSKAEKKQLKKGFCPFCEGNEDKTPPEIYAVRKGGGKNTSNWKIRVVPNKFPALSPEGEVRKKEIGIYQYMDGVGKHEVIIESPKHYKSLHNMTKREIELIIETYKKRYLALKLDEKLRYILIFKNYGEEAGASLSHSHSQIIATPIVPKRVSEELYGARYYFNENRSCVFCDMIKQEKRHKERLVFDSEHFLAFTPYASRFPFEVWILPKRHTAFFETITQEEIKSLSKTFKFVFSRLHSVLNDPPYNYILHTAPASMSDKWPTMEYDYHWHIEIIPKLTKVAGFEWGTGFYINPMKPEDAARYLRE